jgi:hypothetical protein
MLDNAKVKIVEDRFISRLRENLTAVENAGGIREGDNLAELRKLTEGKLSRNELEVKYPQGKSISMRITGKASLFGKQQRPIELAGKVVVRLERLVMAGDDDEQISLDELNATLSKDL